VRQNYSNTEVLPDEVDAYFPTRLPCGGLRDVRDVPLRFRVDICIKVLIICGAAVGLEL